MDIKIYRKRIFLSLFFFVKIHKLTPHSIHHKFVINIDLRSPLTLLFGFLYFFCFCLFLYFHCLLAFFLFCGIWVYFLGVWGFFYEELDLILILDVLDLVWDKLLGLLVLCLFWGGGTFDIWRPVEIGFLDSRLSGTKWFSTCGMWPMQICRESLLWTS